MKFLDQLTRRNWDAIVIGGGMGGAAVACELATQGFDTLLLEKGKSDLSADLHSPAAQLRTEPNERLLVGRWPTRVVADINGRVSRIWPELGCGLGGSSLHYAATLGRLEPSDFCERELPSGRRVRWPFTYEELEPYYLRVERLFGVSGTRDPRRDGDQYDLGEPFPMSDSDRHLFRSFQASGLNPYRLHVGAHHKHGCPGPGTEPCRLMCRSDARTRFIEPSIKTGRVTIVDEASVLGLDASKSSVQGVRFSRQGETLCVRSRVVVLAAGALFSPIILLKSVSRAWPNGVGNDRDLVGRNLMFHASDFILVWASEKLRGIDPKRSFAFRDFYEYGGTKFGELQTMGLSAGYGVILTNLHQRYDRSALRNVPVLKEFLRIPAFAAERLFKQASVFSSIVEDFPYLDNRVCLDDDSDSGMRFVYAVRGELRDRVTTLRRLIKDRLESHRVLVVNEDTTLNLGHPCGTLCSGDDPETSVLDADCRVHDVDNLYVTDGAFMPTSGGTNPSLTIAANALRVGGIIADRLRSGWH
jgi:choline dehydrogenase-like flavoprotein